jgi:small subunit ribosomal protein S9
MHDPYYWGTGRRKTAVARVRMKPGGGALVVNDRPFVDYFMTLQERWDATEPLVAANAEKKWDIFITVKGGGRNSQAGAVRLGIARALQRADATPEKSLERMLKQGGFLSRDPRRKERKKYGLRGARKATQYSKR